MVEVDFIGGIALLCENRPAVRRESLHDLAQPLRRDVLERPDHRAHKAVLDVSGEHAEGAEDAGQRRQDRKSTRLTSRQQCASRLPSSAWTKKPHHDEPTTTPPQPPPAPNKTK